MMKKIHLVQKRQWVFADEKSNWSFLTYSIKDLLFATTLIAVILAWYLHDDQRQKQTEMKIQAIRQLLEGERNKMVKAHQIADQNTYLQIVALNKENRVLHGI